MPDLDVLVDGIGRGLAELGAHPQKSAPAPKPGGPAPKPKSQKKTQKKKPGK